MAMMEVYKQGQGSVVRRLLLLVSVSVGFFMSVSMKNWMESRAGLPGATLLGLPVEWLGSSLGSFAGFPFTAALLISFVLFAVLTFLSIFFAFQKASTGDFLIETDKEMHKVSWPTWRELKGSSLVVVIVTLFLGVYLYVVDAVLSALMGKLI
jgi:preprotein translocase subunit SecE